MSENDLFDPMDCDPLDLVERAGDLACDTRKWPQRLVDMMRVEEQYNLRKGMDPEEAARDAAERTILLAGYIGGTTGYLAKGDAIRIAVKHALIYRAVSRSKGNVKAVAKQFRMAEQKVYEVVRQQHALHVSKVQGRLFEDPAAS